MALYDVVVEAVRAANGFGAEDGEGFGQHLHTLVPELRALRTAYRSGTGTVTVTYTRAASEAYLLAYDPPAALAGGPDPGE